MAEFDYGAKFSEDGKSRLVLWRIFAPSKPLIAFIGLNPSKATPTKNDNTISKLIKITEHNGYGGFYMLNLFTYISTKPKELDTLRSSHAEDVTWILHYTENVAKVVFAWGDFKQARQRGNEIVNTFRNRDPYCLAQNKNGSPKHPLYCLDEQIIIPFDTTIYL